MQDKTKNIAETIAASQCVFHATRFDVLSLNLTTEAGHSVKREFISHPGAVVILPLIDANHIVMIRNQRFAVGQELWELPAGTLEPNEPPESTAYRELIEETGYQAEVLKPLLSFFTSPGICNEIMHVFLASNLKQVGQKLDETEKICVEIVSWKEVASMIHKGTICDGKTLTSLLYYNQAYRT